MLVLGLAAACATATTLPPPADLVVENVTVIDPATRQVLPQRSVFVRGERIVAVPRTGRRPPFAAERTVDGAGRFLIPGLMDMHVHLFLPESPAPSLNPLLANGVTGVREMSSDCWAAAGGKDGCIADYQGLQTRIAAGEVPGPRLLALTSTMIMGPSRLKLPEGAPAFITPTSPTDARSLVRHLAGRGVDLIKTHDSIPPAAFRALMEEANSRGMKVGGHVPFEAGALGAARMGYRSIEHARDLLYDCSRYGPEYRRLETAVAEARPGAVRPSSLDRLRRTVLEFDPEVCATFVKALAATGAYYTPTHVTREMEARADEPAYRTDPDRKYVPAARNTRWEADLDQTSGLSQDQRTALDDFFQHGLRITGLAHKAGVPIMAGTDANDTMIVPGFSLHRELRLLAAAGLSNMEVLRAATTVPAAYLGRTKDLGGIAVGMTADMVLLRQDPLIDIANSASVETVIVGGRVYTRAQLDALLKGVEQELARQ